MFGMLTNALMGAALATTIAQANACGVEFNDGYDNITYEVVADMAFADDEDSYNYWVVLENGNLGYGHFYK